MRIHLFGASGSGCSSLGRDLAHRLGLPFVDTDDVYWEPTDPAFCVRAPAAQRNAKLSTLLARAQSWVLSGSVTSWGLEPLPQFTLAVFVYVGAEVRMARLRAREQQRYGARVQPGADLHATSQAFLRWSSAYDSGELPGRSLAQHRAWHDSLACKRLDAAVRAAAFAGAEEGVGDGRRGW